MNRQPNRQNFLSRKRGSVKNWRQKKQNLSRLNRLLPEPEAREDVKEEEESEELAVPETEVRAESETEESEPEPDPSEIEIQEIVKAKRNGRAGSCNSGCS